MRNVAVLLVVAALGLAGCSNGPHDAAGLTGVEKEGRIYLFVPNSTDHQLFKKSGEMGRSVSAIGAGPNGETVVAVEQAHLDRWLKAQSKKKS
jgi:hypothetical protein